MDLLGVPEAFRRLVQWADVVVAVVEIVPHLLVWELRAGKAVAFLTAGFAVGQAVGQRLHPLVQLLIGLMQAEHPARQFRAGAHHAAQLAQGQRRPGEERVGQRLAQVGDQPAVLVLQEGGQFQLEGGGDPHQHRQGQRALVVLQLVEIAGGKLQRLGQRRLGQAALLAQAAKLVAQEQFPLHTCKIPPARRSWESAVLRNLSKRKAIFAKGFATSHVFAKRLFEALRSL